MRSQDLRAATVDELLAQEAWVKRLARRLATDDASADDLVQESWVVLLRRAELPAALRAFVGTVVRRAARDRDRGADRRGRRERAAASDERVPSTEELVLREERRRHVVAALLELPESYRSVLLLRYFEELSPPDIARRLDLPLETVRTRLRRGLEKLREALDRRLGEERSVWSAALLSWCGSSGVRTSLLISEKAIAGAVAALLLVGAGWFVWREAPTPWSGGGVPGANDSKRLAEAREFETPAEASPSRERVETTPPPIDPEAETRWRGSVVSRDGTAVTAAEVRVFSRSDEEGREPSAALTSGPVDDSGRFDLRGPQRGPGVLLEARAAGFWPARVPAEHGSSTRLVLTPAGRLFGTVIDADTGSPIAGARVQWTSRTGFVQEGLSDARGHYSLSVVPGRNSFSDRGADLVVEAEGHPTLLIDSSRWRLSELPSDARGDRPFDIVLDHGFVVAVAVVDAETRRPISDAQVELRVFGNTSRNVDPIHWTQRTDLEGTAEGPCFGLGFHCTMRERVALVVVRATGYARGSWEIMAAEAGSRTVVEIPLTRSCTITGRVLDDRGEPAADTVVSISSDAGDRRSRTQITDGEGHYCFDQVVPGFEVPEFLTVSAHGPPSGGARDREAATRVRIEVDHRSSIEAPDLVVPRFGTVRVQVVDGEGRPIQGADLELWSERTTDRSTTDPEGRAELHAPRSGGAPTPLRLWVDASGFVGAWTGPFTVDSDAVLELRPVLERSCALSGIVVDRHERPAVDTTVVAVTGRAELDGRSLRWNDGSVDPDSPHLLRATTDAEGRFLVDGLPPGACRVIAGGSSLGEAGPLDTVAGADVRLVLSGELVAAPAIPEREGPALEGRVVEAGSRRPIAGFQAKLEGALDLWPEGRPQFGRYRFEHVPPGSYRLAVSAPGLAAVHLPVEIAKDDDDRQLDVELSRGTTLSGWVRRGRNYPKEPQYALAQYSVMLTGLERGDRQFSTIGSDGHYEVRGLGSGTYVMSLFNHYGVANYGWLLCEEDPRTIRIEPGQEHVTHDTTVSIATVVSFVSHRSEDGPKLTLDLFRVDGDEHLYHQALRPECHYLLGLPRGRYRAEYRGLDGELRVEPFEVLDQERLGLLLDR